VILSLECDCFLYTIVILYQESFLFLYFISHPSTSMLYILFCIVNLHEDPPPILRTGIARRVGGSDQKKSHHMVVLLLFFFVVGDRALSLFFSNDSVLN
jgi:hypothetical protein